MPARSTFSKLIVRSLQGRITRISFRTWHSDLPDFCYMSSNWCRHNDIGVSYVIFTDTKTEYKGPKAYGPSLSPPWRRGHNALPTTMNTKDDQT